MRRDEAEAETNTSGIVHHDLYEFLLVDLAILVQVEFFNHRLSGGQAGGWSIPAGQEAEDGGRPSKWNAQKTRCKCEIEMALLLFARSAANSKPATFSGIMNWEGSQ